MMAVITAELNKIFSVMEARLGLETGALRFVDLTPTSMIQNTQLETEMKCTSTAMMATMTTTTVVIPFAESKLVLNVETI